MLLDFTVENTLSFRDTQQFTMRRTARTTGGSDWPQPKVSTLAALYGGNASGKTNFLRCLRFFSNFVELSFRQGDASSGTGLIPFLLDEESEDRPSTFFAEFIAPDANRYQYWFRLTRTRVVEEVLWLFRSTTNRKTVVFERESGKPTRFGTALRSVGRTIEQITRNNALLLSTAAASGVQAVQPAYDEITKTIRRYGTVNFNAHFAPLTRRLRQNPELAATITQLVRYADLGITGIDFHEQNITAEQADKLASLAAALDALNHDPATNPADADPAVRESPQVSIPHIMFSHAGRGVTRQFSEQWESEGTRNTMLLLLWVIQSLTVHSVMLLDEIDTSLSPAMLTEILDLYRDPRTNPHQSQLIFTTHDLSLISQSGAEPRVLDRDQIWFITKNQYGESSLHPLTEWEDRNVNFGKNYQHNVYAPTPNPSFHEAVAHICEADGDNGDDASTATADRRTR